MEVPHTGVVFCANHSLLPAYWVRQMLYDLERPLGPGINNHNRLAGMINLFNCPDSVALTERGDVPSPPLYTDVRAQVGKDCASEIQSYTRHS